MALGGPLQGHFIGVNDVHQLGHHRSAKQPRRWRRARDHRRAHTAGVAGAGTFISNGGTLKLDTVLNEGGAASRSDTSGRRRHRPSAPAARQAWQSATPAARVR